MISLYIIGIFFWVAYTIFSLAMIVYHGSVLLSYLKKEHRNKWRTMMLDRGSERGFGRAYRAVRYIFNKEDIKDRRVFYLKMRALSWYRYVIYSIIMLILWIVFAPKLIERILQ